MAERDSFQPLPVEVVRDLRRALALAVRDGSPAAHERAWHLANSAAQVIARETCMGDETIGHAVEATAQRMRSRAAGSVIDSRNARREGRIKRG
ncbi:MAG TPA: hypothetical protein VFK05_36690 [Polyangiaceae bacterium]|nr:hypothetical protein [Polyangiaceae bacterium]